MLAEFSSAVDEVLSDADLLVCIMSKIGLEALAAAPPLDSAAAEELPSGVRHVASPASDSLSLLFVTVEGRSSEIAFVKLKDRWYLWANSCKDNASVLSDSSSVEKYFDFMSPENRVP